MIWGHHIHVLGAGGGGGGGATGFGEIFMHTIVIVCCNAGVLLGDPHGQNLFVAHPTIKQSDVRATEALSKNPSKFVLSMMDLFFSRSTLANSLATRKEGRDRLDADIMEGLRRK